MRDVVGRFIKTGLSLMRKPRASKSVEEIVPHKLLKKLITVQLADEAASVIVIRNVGRILRENISYNLVDGVVAHFRKRTIDLSENLLHFLVAVGRYGELYGIVLIHDAGLLPLFALFYYISVGK